MEGLAIDLDPKTVVNTWTMAVMKTEFKSKFKDNKDAWEMNGRVSLDIARKCWKWHQENLGKTFSSSIWVVTEIVIFPDGFDAREAIAKNG